MNIIDWVATNASALLSAVVAFHAFALIVVNLTPTPKDDEALAKAYRVVEWVAGIITPKAKQ
jgi:hypothetical protein